MQLNLSGQTVAVFGSARGIGRAIADEFIREGCQVHGFDRESSAAPLSPGAALTSGDVTNSGQVQAFADRLGEVDHVVFSVGVGSGKFGFPFWKLQPEDWRPVVEINLLGAVNVAHAFARQFVERRKGSMLFLVSVAGQIGSQTDPPYSAAKAGLINFVQCAAKDFAPYGVRVNALAPGMVKTDLNESVWRAGQAALPLNERQDYETWAAAKIRKVSPLGQWQTPPEFAAMAVFLASDHARNITGQTINIDGGQVMHA
ncbi:MAG: Short-chain dehydrogenase/reductase [Verrucomicrobiales bacterium]|nr:Short-chain dehydrogenase/reductase [Verrucomicrobiales bacterium]